MRKPVVYLGIDPGAKGAAALYSATTHKDFTWDKILNLTRNNLEQWVDDFDIRFCVIERQAWGHKLCINYGIWLGMLLAYHIPYVDFTPMEWRKKLFKRELPKGKKLIKAYMLKKARELFPAIEFKWKKDTDRAEAHLMASLAQIIRHR